MDEKITELEDEIIEEKSPFELQLDNVLNKLKLARQIYPKGALVGKEFHKLKRPHYYQHIANVFRPRSIELQTGGHKVFGCNETVQKLHAHLVQKV